MNLSSNECESINHLISTYNKEFPNKLTVITQPPKEILEEDAFISFMVPGDILELSALEKIASLKDSKSADIIYTDHDVIDDCLEQTKPQFKPDWSPELLLSHNYIGPAVFYESSLIQTVGIPTKSNVEELTYDLLLRASEHAKTIIHLPDILFHASHQRLQNIESILQPIQKAINRRHLPFEVELHGNRPVAHLIPKSSFHAPPVTIIIPTKDNMDVLRPCLESLKRTEYRNFTVLIIDNGSNEHTRSYLNQYPADVVRIETPDFNYSLIHNKAMNNVQTEHMVFLNNDTEILDGSWLTELMMAMSLDSTIGAVGAKLLYPNGAIQHAGVSFDPIRDGTPFHLHYALGEKEDGYAYTNQTLRNYNAVTAACLLTRMSFYKKVGGFDEQQFPVDYSDVYYCLKLREFGYRIVWTPHARLLHHEAASRGAGNYYPFLKHLQSRWNSILQNDPYVSPAFTTKSYVLS
ncbi:glycosyltransferase family 2 protein [Patescibacteria group bacterium]|nr:glycosyltransferase family 2 protein [Patescibacteria group bacterium]